MALQIPVISGNVSLYNESVNGAIPPSPMIGCLGVMPDVAKRVTASLQSFSSLLVLTTPRKDECGGSTWYALHGKTGKTVPTPDLARAALELSLVQAAIRR